MSIRKKIDISAATNAKLTSQGSDSDLAYLKANGARALPPSPTANKWDAKSILKQLYKQPEILFAWIKKLGDALEELGINIDDLLAEGTVYSAEHDSEGNVISTFYEAKADADAVRGRMDSVEGRLDANDEEEATHHHLKTDNAGYIVQEFPTSEGESTSEERIINHNDGVSMSNELRLLKEVVVALMGVKSEERGLIDKIIQGTLTAGYANRADRASHDGNGNLIDVTQYGNSVSLSYEQATGKLTVKLYNKAGNEIDSKVIDLPSELVFTDEYYDSNSKKLVFVPASGGSNIEISLSDLVDTYTEGTDPEGIAVVSINNHVIKVSIADGSISMAKLSSTLQTTWNGWVSAEAARVLAEQGRVAAEAQRVANENARLAMPHLDIDNQGYLIINYGSGRDITID